MIKENKDKKVSLSDIVKAQLEQEAEDEETEKNIFKVTQRRAAQGQNLDDLEASERPQSLEKDSHKLIKVKRVRYLGNPATAVYFQDMTAHMKQLELESEFLTKQNRVESLQSYTSTMSHEFRTPLSTCLMFLQGLLDQGQS